MLKIQFPPRLSSRKLLCGHGGPSVPGCCRSAAEYSPKWLRGNRQRHFEKIRRQRFRAARLPARAAPTGTEMRLLPNAYSRVIFLNFNRNFT